MFTNVTVVIRLTARLYMEQLAVEAGKESEDARRGAGSDFVPYRTFEYVSDLPWLLSGQKLVDSLSV